MVAPQRIVAVGLHHLAMVGSHVTVAAFWPACELANAMALRVMAFRPATVRRPATLPHRAADESELDC